MLLQKTFHVHQNPAETAARLAELGSYVHELPAFRSATVDAEGCGHFEFVTGQGFHGHCAIVQLPTEELNQMLFTTKSGNVEVHGLIEFVPIRDHLTEVQITLDYSIRSLLHRVLDRLAGSMDRLINRHLEVLQAHCEGLRHSEAAQRFPSAIIFPASAQLAH